LRKVRGLRLKQKKRNEAPEETEGIARSGGVGGGKRQSRALPEEPKVREKGKFRKEDEGGIWIKRKVN